MSFINEEQSKEVLEEWIEISSKIDRFFMKTDKTRGDRFCRFTQNRVVKLEIFKKLRHFKIKISKKTRVYFKIFSQNRIQKFKTTRPTKFIEM
jgi:hypothetical protein